VTVWNGTTKVVDGTSASAPIFAAIVALLNDALLAQGKPTLGFLNPWLYSVGFKGFVDVTEGSTKGCGTSGFPAMTGWDAASGFGTPVSLKILTQAIGTEKRCLTGSQRFPFLRKLTSESRFRAAKPWYMKLSSTGALG
jgi:tripeptidyl-peptidase-1